MMEEMKMEEMKKEKISINKDLEPLMPQFMANRKEEITSMKKAYDRSAYRELSEIAHGAKGVLGSYGFIGGYDIAQDIDRAAQNQKPDDLLNKIKTLDLYINSVDIFYTDEEF